ncbi:hypothetical protein RJG79_10680 [Mycoplasmatota bacterium WC44]
MKNKYHDEETIFMDGYYYTKVDLNDYEFTKTSFIAIDLHFLSVSIAKIKVENIIKNCPSFVSEILVIHGFNNGTALKEMVAKKIKNKRILATEETSNEGITRIILKDVNYVLHNDTHKPEDFTFG